MGWGQDHPASRPSRNNYGFGLEYKKAPIGNRSSGCLSLPHDSFTSINTWPSATSPIPPSPVSLPCRTMATPKTYLFIICLLALLGIAAALPSPSHVSTASQDLSVRSPGELDPYPDWKDAHLLVERVEPVGQESTRLQLFTTWGIVLSGAAATVGLLEGKFTNILPALVTVGTLQGIALIWFFIMIVMTFVRKDPQHDLEKGTKKSFNDLLIDGMGGIARSVNSLAEAISSFTANRDVLEKIQEKMEELSKSNEVLQKANAEQNEAIDTLQKEVSKLKQLKIEEMLLESPPSIATVLANDMKSKTVSPRARKRDPGNRKRDRPVVISDTMFTFDLTPLSLDLDDGTNKCNNEEPDDEVEEIVKQKENMLYTGITFRIRDPKTLAEMGQFSMEEAITQYMKGFLAHADQGRNYKMVGKYCQNMGINTSLKPGIVAYWFQTTDPNVDYGNDEAFLNLCAEDAMGAQDPEC